MLRCPGPEGPDYRVAVDIALVGGYGLNGSGAGVVAGDLDAGADLDAVLLAFLDQAAEDVPGTDVAADALIEGYVNAVCLEVGPDGGEEVPGFLADV